MNNGTEKKKTGLGVLDAVIIIALCACIAAAVFAFMYKENTVEELAGEEEFEEYVVSFESYAIRRSTAQMLAEGDTFIFGNDEEFGSLTGALTIVPATVYTHDESGACIKTYAPENGDETKMDVTGTLPVTGTKNDRGVFVLNGTTELAPNKTLTVHTDTVALSISVTDIGKVAK